MFSPVGQNTSRYPKLTDTQKGFQRIDSKLWDKTYLTENHDTCPLFYPQYFLILKIFANHRRFPISKLLGTVRQKFCLKTPDIRLLGIKFFITRNILIHSRVFFEVIRCCEAKQFGREQVIPAHSFIPKVFRYQIFCKSQKVSTFVVFWYCETTNFSKKLVKFHLQA